MIKENVPPNKADNNGDLSKQEEICKVENLPKLDEIRRQWKLPELTISLMDIHAQITSELQKEGMSITAVQPENSGVWKAKPLGSLKEQDPLKECLKITQPEGLENLKKDDEKPAKEGTSQVNIQMHKTESGEIQIKQYGIRHAKKQKKKLLCSGCDQVFGFVKDFNCHMKEQHPDLKFRCQYCPKNYDTYNAHYKHEYKHFQLPYKCHYCEKRFLFPGLQAKHKKQHTGKGLLPCTWPECKVKLSCKDALRQQIVTHTEVRFPCTQCNKTFNTITNMQQHTKGVHGDGFIALCGAAYDWSDQ